MSTLTGIVYSHARRFAAPVLMAALAGALVVPASAQLQWSSYNTSGALVTANVASGGDAGFGGSVTFTIPASKQLTFLTKTFVPVSIAAANASAKVNFSMNASGGMEPTSAGRLFGMGLLNDPNTAASGLDDTGYWVDFNTGNPSFELFDRPNTVTSFFTFDTTDKLGTGKVSTGLPTNGITYGLQFQLNMNSSANSVSIGTSSSSWAAAGAAITNGNGAVNETAFSSGVSLTTLATTTFNEFAFMFNNTSASAVTVTLNNITIAPANPEITGPPVNFSGAVGTMAQFGVSVVHSAVTPIAYQWYETNSSGVFPLTDGTTANGSVISGSSSPSSTSFTNTLTVNNIQLADAGSFFVVITNVYGAVTSAPVAMAVTAGDVAPTILSISPASATVVSGSSTNIVVNAQGSPSPVFYWLNNNNNLLQSGSSFGLTLNNLQLANAGTYTVTVSNYLGSVSTNFTINVIVPPCISQQPGNVLVNAGDPVSFSVVEGGCATPAPAYQWLKNGAPISGATSATFSIASAALTDIGNYSVIVSNSAGTATSLSAKLGIYSTVITGSPVLPANNASGLCLDTYLQIAFNQTPTVGNIGKINIYNAASPATPVDTIDLSLNNGAGVQARSLFAGDSQAFNYYPVVITGNTATIYPHSGKLAAGQTYYVTIDPGVILDSTGAYYPGVTNATTWQFSTKASGPVSATNLVVDASGNADFVTVQGAVDSIPLNSTNRTLINIHNGSYFEIVDIASKHNVTFRGQSRNGTVVYYPNNANIAVGGTTHARMAFKVFANNISIENMTVSNSTPQGGSQAEALMIESGAGHFILNNAEVDSRQDTILANVNTSQGYFYNSLVTGNFDYVWGGGNLFFTNCQFRTISGASQDNLSAPRTDNSLTAGNWPGYSGALVSNGFSFVRCQLTRQSGAISCSMSDANGSPNGLAAWINCSLDTDTFGYTNALSTAYTTQLLWEYGCSNLNNTVSLNNSATPFIGFTQLNTGDPRLLAAANATNWLNGWQPQLAPNIVIPPAGQTVSAGQAASFSVSATGIPDPAYQWLDNGVPISGATGSSFTIASAVRTNAGNYSVVVNNGSGSVTSAPAVLAYTGNAMPAGGATFTVGVAVNASVTVPIVGGKYPPTDADGDALTITGVGGATNGTVTTDGVNVTYTATNGTSDSFTYTVADGFGGTGAGTVNIAINNNVQGQNQLAGTTLGNGTNIVTFLGIPGLNYALDLATNLTPPINWMPQATNPAANNGFLIFTNVSTLPQIYYRTRYAP